MTTEKHDPWALLREARVFVGFCPTTQEGIDRVCEVRDRIDAALAGRNKPVQGLNAEERIWQAYRNRELTEDEARERLAALKAEEAR
jgi:hypothetical protein